MSTNISDVIKMFSKFLDPKLVQGLQFSDKGKIIKLESISDIQKLPLSCYKFLTDVEAFQIERFLEIKTIGDASKLDKFKNMEKFDEKIKKFLSEQPNLEAKMKKTLKISNIISNLNKSTPSLEKSNQKVVVVGLDNAGKTAILSKFGGKLGIKALAGLKPTKGVNRRVLSSSDVDLFIWDMGGQEEYREKYLDKPDHYFLQIDLLIYVIDVQDSARFEMSFEYFEQILDTLITLEENPHTLIFFHKYDPDLKTDSTIQLNLEFLKENFKDLFTGVYKDFEYEIYLTSIYSMISNEPEFSKHLKNVLKSYSLSNPVIKKVEGLGNILEDTMNAVITLSESITIQLNNIESRLSAIERGSRLNPPLSSTIDPSSSTPQIGPSSNTPQIDDSQIPRGAGNARTTVLGELKDLFAKKRSLDL